MKPLFQPSIRHACQLRAGHLMHGIACAALLVYSTSVVRSQQPGQSPPVPLGILVDVGGYRIHLDCAGDGSPTVMIVGAAFSFDWGLVQPEVAKFTHVCTFDPSGTAWSDSFETVVRALDPGAAPKSMPTCDDRVNEIHRLIVKVPIVGPYILVGFSVGALWERLYTAQYPKNVVGMVIVDHAFLPDAKASATTRSAETTTPSHAYSAPVLVSQTPIVLGFEDDVNFNRLPQRDQALHAWALAQHPVRPDEAMVADCLSRIQQATGDHPYPFGNLPLTVIRTPNEAPGYDELQGTLLALSHHSQQVIAWNSSHLVKDHTVPFGLCAAKSSYPSARHLDH
jgi:pimeloyl-ACP methyl ester carboxylesterase